MSTLILRPIQDTATVGQEVSSGMTHYVLIDEATKDEADYCFNYDASVTTKTDLYDLKNHDKETGTINSVTVKLYAKYTLVGTDSGTAYVKPLVRVGDTNYGDNQALTDAVALYSQTWTVNPATSSAWTWTNIDALKAGDALTNCATSAKNFKATYCYQLWVEVDYGGGGGGAGHTSVVQTNKWNNAMDAKVAVGGNIEAVQNGWVVVNGVWQKWWPPPSTAVF